MDQKKIENLIWNISSKTKIPDPPNKEEAWDTLSQNMDNLKPSSLVKESSFFQNIIKFWILSIHKPNYTLFLPMIL